MNQLTKIAVVAVFALVLHVTFFSTVFAVVEDDAAPTRTQNTVRTTEIEQLRQERQEARVTVTELRNNQFEERREEVRTQMQERRADFAQKHADRIERRFNLYAEYLLNVATRIETRTQMMSKNDKNTTEALAKVTEARSYITSAQTKGTEAVSKFRTIDVTTYDTQRAIALEARDLAGAGREDFKSARDLLHEAVRTLVQTQNQE